MAENCVDQVPPPPAIDYQRLIEHIPAITYIAMWDEESSTLYTSPQIESLLGFTQAQWMADNTLWLKQIHPDDRVPVMESLANIHAGAKPIPIEYRMLTSNKQVRWFRDDAAVMIEDGQPRYLYGVMLDITHQKELEAVLVDVQRQLWEAQKPKLEHHEREVLRLLYNRYTECEIARELAISERTVRNWLKGICTKLEVTNRAEAVRKAIRWELFESSID